MVVHEAEEWEEVSANPVGIAAVVTLQHSDMDQTSAYDGHFHHLPSYAPQTVVQVFVVLGVDAFLLEGHCWSHEQQQYSALFLRKSDAANWVVSAIRDISAFHCQDVKSALAAFDLEMAMDLLARRMASKHCH